MDFRELAPRMVPDEAGPVGGPGPSRPQLATDPNPPTALGSIARNIGGGIADTALAEVPMLKPDPEGAPGAMMYGPIGRERSYEYYAPGGLAAAGPKSVNDYIVGLGHVAGDILGGRAGFNEPPFSKVMKGGKPTRVYRGVQQVYDEENPTRWSEHSMYGPGSYHTEAPKVASGYSNVESFFEPSNVSLREQLYQIHVDSHDFNLRQLAVSEKWLAELLARNEDVSRTYNPHNWVKYWEDELVQREAFREKHGAAAGPAWDKLIEDTKVKLAASKERAAQWDIDQARRIKEAQEDIQGWKARAGETQKTLDRVNTDAPNVRASYLDLTKVFDVDKGRISRADIRRFAKENPGAVPTTLLDEANRLGVKGGLDYYGLVNALGSDKAAVKTFLESLGYQGLTHIGGIRSGGTQHRVWINFHPEREYKGYTPMGDLP